MEERETDVCIPFKVDNDGTAETIPSLIYQFFFFNVFSLYPNEAIKSVLIQLKKKTNERKKKNFETNFLTLKMHSTQQNSKLI